MAGVWLFAVVTVLTVSAVFPRPQGKYNGYKVLQITSDGDVRTFAKGATNLIHDFDVDVWSRGKNSADVMVSPSDFAAFQRAATAANLKVAVKIDDVQSELDREYQQRSRVKPMEQADITNTYLRYAEINDFLNTVVTGATEADVTMRSMGLSVEGRETNYLEIKEKGSTGQKLAVVIDAGIHAREWISVAVALNVIQKLTLNPENDPDVQDMLQKFDWFIAPVVNPDGYDYSHGPNNRLWRKSRTTEYSRSCPGVDLNRNFGYEWDPARGGSTNPCSSVYSGPNGFSEPETQNIRDWLAPLANRTRLYLNTHAYGEVMLYPYGWDDKAFREEEHLMSQIRPVADDTWEGLKAMAREVFAIYNN
ncbi:hypothetical protein BaRGS_00023395 [Batillaria attramentaria]|uniref:Peptidase M14 domain-containing protein n=1 Tax=Batillaria attramentaria TaxID=370345 RepID=A0ABD0KDW2_9CAEN